VAVVWAVAMLVGGSVQQVKFPRYLLPLTPTLFAFAGGMLTIPWVSDGENIGRWGGCEGRASWQLWRPRPSMDWPLRTCIDYPTRGWRPANGCTGASCWHSHRRRAGDDALPLDITLDGQPFVAKTHVETCAIDPFAEPDDEAKLRRTLDCLAGADYLILSSNRAYGVIPRLTGRYPLTAAYYRALFGGDLGFELARSFERPLPCWAGRWSMIRSGGQD